MSEEMKKNEMVKEDTKNDSLQGDSLNDSLKEAFKGKSMKNIIAQSEEETPKNNEQSLDDGSQQPMDHLSRMRLQMLAQKQLDKGLMEKEAKKSQTKEMLERLSDLEENDSEEESLYDEIEILKGKINELELEINKYKSLLEESKESSNSINSIKKENQKLLKDNKKLLEEKKLTFDKLMTRISDLQKENKEINSLNKKITTKQNKLLDENGGLKEKLVLSNKELVKSKKRVTTLEEAAKKKISSEKDAKDELARITKDLSLEKSLNENLKKQINDLEIKNKEVVASELVSSDNNKELIKLKKEVETLTKKCDLIPELKKDNSLKLKENKKLLVNKEKQEEAIKEKKKEIAALKRQVKKDERNIEKLTVAKKETNDALKASIKEKDILTKNNNELEEKIAANKAYYTKKQEEFSAGYLEAINERIALEEALAREISESKQVIRSLNEELKELKEEIVLNEQNYLLQIEERLQYEESLSKSIKEKEEIIENLEKQVAKKDETIMEEKEAAAEILNEELKRIKVELDLIKQREVINLRRVSDIVLEKEENSQKVLKEKIYDCDKQLNEIENSFGYLDETSIVDPEFKEKIRKVREIKQEITQGIEKEKAQFAVLFDDLLKKINQKNNEIKVAVEKVENIDSEYHGGSRTSFAREEYTARRSKALIELESIKARTTLLNEEYNSLKSKFDDYKKHSDENLAKINNTENEIINFYLNKLKDEMLKDNSFYQEKTTEKNVLLEQLKNIDEEVVEKENDKVADIKNELANLHFEYDELANKLSIIKDKQEERLESQRKVEEKDEYIKCYISLKEELSNIKSFYEENSEGIANYQKELNEIAINENTYSQRLQLRARIQNNQILNTDLSNKMEIAKNKIAELRKNPHVVYYIQLLESMDELSEKYRIIYSRMEILLKEIAQKEEILANIEEGL